MTRRRKQYQETISEKQLRTTMVLLAFAILLAPTVLAIQSAQAQTYSVLYSFTGTADGGGPSAGLTLDNAGNLYGTTFNGGNLTGCSTAGCGTVFQLDTAGGLTVLHSFTGERDGANPFGALVSDARGDLFGTTTNGGGATCPPNGCGTVFKLNTTGKYRVLYHFSGRDGKYPEAGVVLDAAGNLYGTTPGGGDLTCADGNGCGTVFQLDATGTLTLLHSFSGADGLYPYVVLVRDAVGNLYGTTFGGGAYGFGTVFKVDTTGTLTVLVSFSSSPDGSNPNAGLIRDASGNLYGTTPYGGIDTCSPFGCGTVFKVDANGNETVLYSFTGGLDGSHPFAGLLQDAAGNLYGTTYEGGDVHCNNEPIGCGTVFKLDPVTAKFRILHRFAGGTDGALSYAGLISDGTGNLVGTTQAGGSSGHGTVFRISPR